MKQSLEKLQKYFTLEAGRNYDNKAVMGGWQAWQGCINPSPFDRNNRLASCYLSPV